MMIEWLIMGSQLDFDVSIYRNGHNGFLDVSEHISSLLGQHYD